MAKVPRYADLTASLKEVVPVHNYINSIDSTQSPFLRVAPWNRLKTTLIQFFLRRLEVIINKQLLVENTEHELNAFSKSARNFLTYLLANKYVYNWDCGIQNQYLKECYVCSIYSNQVLSKNGEELVPRGAFAGHGADSVLTDALLVAEAEFVERYSVCWWDKRYLTYGTISQFKKKKFAYYIHNYFSDEPLDESLSIGWLPTRDLLTGKKVYTPASYHYLWYYQHNPYEPYLIDVSTNGVAASTDKAEALVKAILEKFERDGLLYYWLTKQSPTKIDLSDCELEHVRMWLANLEAQNYEVHLLDCTVEYDVPVFVMVLIDKFTNGVAFNAAAGFSIDAILEKLFFDTMRFDSDSWRHAAPSSIRTINDREILWSGGHVERQVYDFFLNGPQKNYSSYRVKTPSRLSSHRQLAMLKRIAAKKELKIYWNQYKNDLTRYSGLKVVRAIIPDLIPVYLMSLFHT